MPVTRMKVLASAERGRHVLVDLLIAPVVVAVALVMSVLVPVRAYAQTNMTLQQLVPNLIRNISQTVTASPSGLTVLQAGEVDIGVGAMNTGNGIIGRVMINEGRGVAMASIASRAVGLVTPIALTLLAADLISYGIKQCQTSPNGWCKPGVANPASTDTGFNGFQWTADGTNLFDSPQAACQAWANNAFGNNTAGTTATFSSVKYYSPTSGGCVFVIKQDGQVSNPSWNGVGVQSNGRCVKNYVASGSQCVVDPNANVQPQPVQYPELASNLANVMSGNPNRAKDYWGIMPPDQWYAALGDASTQALPAQILSPANGQVVGPKTTTTTSAGTTTSQQTVTVSPNTDTGTLAEHPVTVTVTTTTTNPDGTTTTTTTTQSPTAGGTGGGGNPQPQPASSPTPCGLGTSGSPKCLIDETGTPSKADAGTAMAQPSTDLQTAEQTAEAQLQNVNNSRSWTLTMPHILPGGSCQPIEWFSWGSWRGTWDVCTQLQYVHDLLAWLWPVLSAVYVWNKAAGANAGAV